MDAERQTRLWPLSSVGALFIAGVLSVVAWNVEIPYLAFSVGPVSDAADAVVVEDVEVYPPEGELLMLTVTGQDVNLFEALIAAIDPDIDLVPREAVRSPDESDEDYRRRTLQIMDDSVQTAITVALSHLGYDMTPTDVIVVELLEGVPAAEVLEPGDSILSLNGVEIVRSTDLTDALAGLSPEDTVALEISRAGSTRQVSVRLVARDDGAGGAMIGIVVRELTEPPFPVTIESGIVGGPSAGMMYALALIDSLTPGDLTAGHIVAGTGTITPDGGVGNIGGVRQKVIGAEAAGAEFVLVPRGNYEEALTARTNAIEIVPVNTVFEALAFLEGLEPGPVS